MWLIFLALLVSASAQDQATLFRMLDAVINTPHVEGHSNQVPEQITQYNSLFASHNVICETGFNVGHSSLRMLTQNPQATVYSFDIGDGPGEKIKERVAQFLHTYFPSRLHLTWGDSQTSLPIFRHTHPHVTCDLAIIDGGHSHEVAKSDLEHLYAMTRQGGVIVMDDTPCVSAWCHGPTAAWQEYLKKGLIKETYAWGSPDRSRGFSYGVKV